MSKYDRATSFEPKEYTALPEGKYGSSKEPGLRIVNFNGVYTPQDDPELTRYNFLVAATNGKEGTAFFSIALHGNLLNDAVYELAFPPGDNENYETPETVRDAAKQLLYDRAAETVAEQGSSDPQEIEREFGNILTTIRINVGNLLRLQAWGNQERDFRADPATLLGVSFSGTIKRGRKEGTSEVKSVYRRGKEKTQ